MDARSTTEVARVRCGPTRFPPAFDGTDHLVTARVDGRRPPQRSEAFHVLPRPGHVHLFDVTSGERLGD